MSRVDQSQITVTVDGEETGVWDKRSGGARTSESTKYRPGPMGQPRSLGGHPDTDNVTVSRLFDLDRDHLTGLARRLYALCGAARCTVVDQPLDVKSAPVGSANVFNGTLVGCTWPEKDSESVDPAVLAIEIEVDGQPT